MPLTQNSEGLLFVNSNCQYFILEHAVFRPEQILTQVAVYQILLLFESQKAFFPLHLVNSSTYLRLKTLLKSQDGLD